MSSDIKPHQPHSESSSDTQTPDIIIEQYPTPITNARHLLQLNQTQLDTLNALLKMIPNIFPSGQALNGTYVLRFTPEIAGKIADGTYKVMQSTQVGLRAMAVNAQGQIVAHGTLVAATGLQFSTIALAAWQVLAVITAQHYLPDIQRRLVTIEAGIQELKMWKAAEDNAHLISSLKYLQDILFEFGNVSRSKESRMGWHHQIESIYLDVDRVFESYRSKLAIQVQQLNQLDPVDWFGAERVQQTITGYLHQVESMAIMFLSALVVKMTAVERLSQLNDNTSMYDRRLAATPDDIAFLNQYMRDYSALVIKKSQQVGGIMDPWGRDAEQRKIIVDNAMKTKQRVTTHVQEVIQIASMRKTQLDYHRLFADKGAALVIAMNDEGQIAQVYEAGLLLENPALSK